MTGGIPWVGQEDSSGCALAVLAMLTRRSYGHILDDLGRYRLDGGLNSWDVDEYLADNGFALQRIFERFHRDETPRDPWPPEPFAREHPCKVQVYESSPQTHYVVMDGVGGVLDPLTPDPRRLRDYYRVFNVAGVWAVKR